MLVRCLQSPQQVLFVHYHHVVVTVGGSVRATDWVTCFTLHLIIWSLEILLLLIITLKWNHRLKDVGVVLLIDEAVFLRSV